jgi:nuclear pore complex protein Nup155
MGLFPEINRAWMTIGNKFFLWDYHGSDVTSWMEAEEAIIDVVLVRPKTNVFVDSIQWLLVIITPNEVNLLGLSFKEDSAILHQTGLVFSTDQVSLLSAVGTLEGRIFCAGQDGQIYELLYQSDEGWFSRKCRKINKTGSILSHLAPAFLKKSINDNSDEAITSLCYDSSRGLLWSLSEGSGRIECYFLGNDRASWEKIGAYDDCSSSISKFMTQSGGNPAAARIVGIHPVSSDESSTLHLIAVGSNGVRCYFTTFRASGSVPCSVDLLHVRLPPQDDLGGRLVGIKRTGQQSLLAGRLGSSTILRTSFYKKGVFLASGTLGEEEDMILCRSLNPSAALQSSATSVELEHSTDIKIEGRIWAISENQLSVVRPLPTSSCWDEITKPHLSESRIFLCLTNAGIYTLEKERPVDALVRILSKSNGSLENEAVVDFYTRTMATDQAIALTILMLISREFSDSTGGLVKFWALQAISKFAGEPSLSNSGSMNINITNLSSPALSSLIAGFYRSFGKIVGGIWKKSLNQLATSLEIGVTMESLKKFSKLFEQHGSLFMHARPQLPGNEEKLAAYQIEFDALVQLQKISNVSLELLAFILICVDYGINLEKFAFDGGIMIDFELLVTSSIRTQALVHEIVQALVQKQLSLQASVESLCHGLKDRCPSFFTAADMMVYEGKEILERAFKVPFGSPLQEDLIEEALKAFISAAPKIVASNTFGEIIKRLRILKAYPGILKLTMSIVPHLPEESDRQALYDEVLQSFTDLICSPNGQLDSCRNKIFTACLHSDNVEFLYCFYDWVFEEQLASFTFLTLSPTNKSDVLLENYLESKTFANGGQVCKETGQIFCKYLIKVGNNLKAAQVLVKMATISTNLINLSERIQYLSMAISNLKSVLNTDSGVSSLSDLLEESEDRLEVALLQFEVLNQTKALPNISEPVIQELNSSLFSVTDLFLRFAKPLNLAEASLFIIHLAGHSDPLLVSQLWQQALFKDNTDRKSLETIARCFPVLATKLYPSEFAFPLAYLVDLIALVAYQQIEDGDIRDERVVIDWFVSLWKETPVPLVTLFDALEKLLMPSGNSKFWAGQIARKVFLLRLLISLAINIPKVEKSKEHHRKILDRLAAHSEDNQLPKEIKSELKSAADQIRKNL